MNPGRPFSYLWRFVWRLIRFVDPLAPDEALHRTIWAFAGLFLTCAVGVAGYVLIEDFSPFDALYQTLLTITTVGFQELQPLSREARAFTILLMVFGVGIALYLVSAIATLILEGELYRDVERRRQRRMLDQMMDHTIFVGAGRMGLRLAQEAENAGDQFVVIEVDPNAAHNARDLGWNVVQDDAEHEQVLHSAGVERANALVVATGDDAANTFIILKAREIAPTLRITARCNQPGNERVMTGAGASEVLSPIEMVVERYAASRESRG